MSSIGYVGGFSNTPENPYKADTVIDITQINSVFATDLIEKERTTFSNSFWELNLDDKNDSSQANRFVQGLINNRESLSHDLNLNLDEYDSLACIALALASQETGMGNEKGYVFENVALYGMFRRAGKAFLNMIGKGDGSASSGLTQIKINDFIKNWQTDENKSEKFALFEKYGIKPNTLLMSDIFREPEKAAITTMIILSDILSDYDTYIDTLQHGYNNNPDDRNDHEEVRSRLDPDLSDQECIEKGLNTIDSIKGAYDNMEPDEQEKLRNTLKNWVLSYDGSLDNSDYAKTDSKDKEYKYNEERQLNILNEMLSDYGVEIQQGDLEYIRYALTDESQIMTPIEFCGFAWNNGIHEGSMKNDRLIAAKIGAIFMNPEDYDYEQFAVNVENIAGKYAQQSGSDIDTLNYILTNLALNKD